MFYLLGIFRTSAQEAASQVTLRELLQGSEGRNQVKEKFCYKGQVV